MKTQSDIFTALIVDIKRSRSLDNSVRNDIQKYIYNSVCVLNDIFNRSLVKDVEFSGGDEIQGLFRYPESAYLYFRLFNMLAAPLEIRAGIGVGEWNVVLKNAGTTAQDGPAYHNARKAINNAKATDGYSALFFSGGKNDIYINSSINTSSIIINKNSEHQNILMLLSEILYPIYIDDIYDVDKIRNLASLIAYKHQLYSRDFFKRNKSTKSYDELSEIKYNIQTISPVDAYDTYDSFFVNSRKTRGLSTNLADLLNITRQSIEKTLKAANLYEARNATIITLNMMNEF